MGRAILALLLLTNIGCDIAQFRSDDTGKCMEHTWIKGTYLVVKFEPPKVYMRNIEDGKRRETSMLEHGWKKVDCPKNYGTGSSNSKKEK